MAARLPSGSPDARTSASARCEESRQSRPEQPDMPGRSVNSRDFPACRDARWKSTSGAFSGAPHSNTCSTLDQARRKLARAAPSVNVTEIAGECGFNHLGRFAIAYRGRYAGSPSDTLRRSRIPASAILGVSSGRAPASVQLSAIIPFGLVGEGTACMSDLGGEIAAALGRTGWIGIAPAPGRALSASRDGER